jgi:hypothetical protein
MTASLSTTAISATMRKNARALTDLLRPGSNCSESAHTHKQFRERREPQLRLDLNQQSAFGPPPRQQSEAAAGAALPEGVAMHRLLFRLGVSLGLL